MPRHTGFAVCAALSAAVVLTPWTVRNYVQFHKLFFIRNNLGLELFISNHDSSQGSFQLNHRSGNHLNLHPNNSREQPGEVRRQGEIRYNYQRMAAAITGFATTPPAFCA